MRGRKGRAEKGDRMDLSKNEKKSKTADRRGRESRKMISTENPGML